ncbi:hypothetical protein C2S51_009055, partial [Perilla frutescens var. frutescens]
KADIRGDNLQDSQHRPITFTTRQSINMSIVPSTDHNCYDHYVPKNYMKLFSCDGCKMRGYGERHHCNPCGRELHKECRFPTATISNEHFPGSTFKFRYEPLTRLDNKYRKEFSKCCDACGKEICGFSYRCDENDKDLHPCCRNLEKKLLIENTIFDLRPEVFSKCIRCKKRKITDGERDVRGWSYVSTCNKYHFHVYCMMEMVHEACMKYGEIGLERVELRQLVKSRRNGGSRANKMIEMMKSVLKIMLAALLGDPTVFISNVFVELVSRGFQ